MFSITWGQSKKSVAGSAFGAFFVLLASACQGGEHDCPPFAETERVAIAKVIDGDTVHLVDGRKVRLIGINTPELGYDKRPDQPYATAARDQLKRFLGTHALLLTDQGKHDKYGRTLAHLYNLKGQSAEADLLKTGLAWHVAIPPNLSQANCLANAEQLARHQSTALWSDDGIKATSAAEVSQGGFQRIQGNVTGITFGKNGWWINLGSNIAAVIYPQHQHRFDRQALETLAGKAVTVRGWVYPSRSKKYQPWRIKLETPFALKH